MDQERNRLATFKIWPPSNQAYPTELAHCGFYYTGEADRVQCFCCNIILGDWQWTQFAKTRHMEHSPRCEFITGCHTPNVCFGGLPFMAATAKDPCNNQSSERLNDHLSMGPCLNDHLSMGPGLNGDQSHSGRTNTNGDQQQSNKSVEDEVRKWPCNQIEDLTGTIGDQMEDDDVTSSHDDVSSPLDTQILPNGPFMLTTGKLPSHHVSNLEQAHVADIPNGQDLSSDRESEDVIRDPLVSTVNRSNAESVVPIPTELSTVSDYQHNTTSGGPPGSISFQQLVISLTDDQMKHELRRERVRLASFQVCHVDFPMPSEDLARAGFYYIGPADRVKCIFCQNVLLKWETGDVPQEEHGKFFPNCAFVINRETCGNVPLEADSQPIPLPSNSNTALTSLQSSSTSQNLGIMSANPCHPRYRLLSQRLVTFTNWPPTAPVEPGQLAEAGFYYAGEDDVVRCWFCDMGLRRWQPGDVPWEEHARWYPKCGFVSMVKGQEYIEAIQAKYRNTAGSNIPWQDPGSPNANAATNATSAQTAPGTSENASNKNEETNEDLQCQICMDAARNIVFLPCGHLTCCSQCAHPLAKCPICRQLIRGTVKVYLS